MRSPALTILAALVCSCAAERAAVLSRPSSQAAALLPQQRLRGGAAEVSDDMLQATFACNRLYASVLADASAEVAELRKLTAGGEAVPDFGTKADDLLTEAAEKFASSTPAGQVGAA